MHSSHLSPLDPFLVQLEEEPLLQFHTLQTLEYILLNLSLLEIHTPVHTNMIQQASFLQHLLQRITISIKKLKCMKQVSKKKQLLMLQTAMSKFLISVETVL